MRDPAFWWRPAGVAAALLAPVAACYGAIAAARMARAGRAAGVPVVCVGNLTVGGSGKTPTAIAVAELLIAVGRRPVFLSRGYGGRLAGPVQVDPATHGAADVGDEPLLLARVAPTIVARDRVAGAAAARAAGANVIVMDDGFQNPGLAKSFSLIVVDGRRGLGNGLVLPAGPLRAPLAAQLERANAMLVIGPPSNAAPAITAALARSLPVLYARLEPDARALAALQTSSVLAFAGIGDPDKFFATLTQAGIDVRARQAFPDHHRYRRAEADGLVAQAARERLTLVTTEKDLARLVGAADLAPLATAARALPVRVAAGDENAFRALVLANTG